jgi:hypothetical protein
MYPWQQQMFKQISSSGIEPKGMILVTSGRGAGKSVLYQQSDCWWLGASAECDDGVWHSVICFEAVSAWIRAQDADLWMETTCPNGIGSTFDIADSLLVLLSLRWSRSRA